LIAVLPVLSVTVSGPHDVQAVAPVVLEYAPRPHAVNGPMGFPKNPALAMQAELSAFGMELVHHMHKFGIKPGVYFPAGHLAHASDPTVALNVPATHIETLRPEPE
jgi:hypothetical protein